MKYLLLLLLLPVTCFGQGDQTIINVPINASGTTTFEAILHLPNDYDSTTTSYPLILFFHGAGEGGPNPSSIYNSSTAGGPAYFISQGTFPTSFVNPKDGKSYKFIVLSPQAYPQGVEGSTTAQEADYILNYMYAHYRVDTTRVYFTGLSDGGETVVEYVGADMTNGGNFTRFTKTHHVAAIIPMSENASAELFQEEADSITADKIYSWGFGSTDTQGQNTMQLANYCNAIKPGTMITTSYTGGHCCWGQFYNPTFTQNGMSIYQWLLQYQTPVAAPPPVVVATANAGTAQTVQMPTSQTTLCGSSSTVTNGTITGYTWAQQSGPASAVIDSPTACTTTVKSLSTGTYVFGLTVTDNVGNTSTATVPVTVMPAVAVDSFSIPGTIQSETYVSSYGVQTQATTDSGGGLNVGWINLGDWMDYSVDVATAGTYTVGFRIATPGTGAILQLRAADGTVLTTVPLPATGGYQHWETITTLVNLPAGKQTLQVYSATVGNFNINWMQFDSGDLISQVIPGKIEAESYTGMSGVMTQSTTDTGGGLNVGWIDQGDWMTYMLNAAIAGNYTVNFRIAAPIAGAVLQVRGASDTVLASVPLPATGGYQDWITVSTVLKLPAGSQTLQLYSASAEHWNINWMQFVPDTADTASDAGLMAQLDTGLRSSKDPANFVLYPNPVNSAFTVRVNDPHIGNMVVQVIDASGALRREQAFYKDQPAAQVTMPATDLLPGVYFVRVQIGAWSGVKKLLKN